MNKYPSWVCHDCATKALKNMTGYSSKYAGVNATFHEDKCDVCQETKPVTEPRDYNYPPLEAFEFKP